MSTGTGKMVVELFSVAISARVCRVTELDRDGLAAEHGGRLRPAGGGLILALRR